MDVADFAQLKSTVILAVWHTALIGLLGEMVISLNNEGFFFFFYIILSIRL